MLIELLGSRFIARELEGEAGDGDGEDVALDFDLILFVLAISIYLPIAKWIIVRMVL